MSRYRQEAVNSFDKNASRYHQGVYQKKRADMLAKLNTQLNVLFVGQLKNLHKKAITSFNENLKVGLKKPNYIFATTVEECQTNAKEFFLSSAKGNNHTKYIVHTKNLTHVCSYCAIRYRLVIYD